MQALHFLQVGWHWFGENWYWLWIVFGSSIGGIWSRLRGRLKNSRLSVVVDIVETFAESHGVDLEDEADDAEEHHDSTSNDKDGAKDNLKILAVAIAKAQRSLEQCGAEERLRFEPAVKAAASWFASAVSEFQKDEDWDESVSSSVHGIFQAELVRDAVAEFVHQLAVLNQEHNPALATGATTDGATAKVVIPEGAADDYSPAYTTWQESGDEDNDRCKSYREWRKLVLLMARYEAVRAVLLAGKDRVLETADTYIGRCHDYLEAAEKKATDGDWDDVKTIIDDGLLFARLTLQATEAHLGRADVTYTLADAQWDTDDDYADAGTDEGSQDAIKKMVAGLIAARGAVEGRSVTVAQFLLDEAEKSHRHALDLFYDEKYADAKREAQYGNFCAQVAAEATKAYLEERRLLETGKPSTLSEALQLDSADWVEMDADIKTDCAGSWRELTIKIAKLQAAVDTKPGALQSTEPASLVTRAMEHLAAAAAVSSEGVPEDWSDTAVPTSIDEGMKFVGSDALVKPVAPAAEAPAAAEAVIHE